MLGDTDPILIPTPNLIFIFSKSMFSEQEVSSLSFLDLGFTAMASSKQVTFTFLI